jgi:hypothetical protein
VQDKYSPFEEYATPRQLELIAAIRKYGSENATNDALGMANDKVSAAMRRLRANAARLGMAPGHFNQGVAPGNRMGKVTIQRAADGSVERTWERQHPTAEAALDALREAVAGILEPIKPVDPIPTPLGSNDDLCNLYTYSDFHLGMLAQEEEGGANWDIKIAERTLVSSFSMMLAQSPPAHTGIVNIQGDMLHSDGLLPVTPAHRHVLDQDGRFSRIVAVAIRSIRALINMALGKHPEVHVVICEGNHDEASSVWLRLMFQALYENEPRVTVNASELPFYVFEWGRTMLGFHHGHKVKNEQLPLLFAAQFPDVWGRTSKRAVHCGHRHHCDEKEYNGVTVVQHPTIAARDAYAARGGWIADRAVQSITYSKRFGQVGRVFVTPEMLREAA